MPSITTKDLDKIEDQLNYEGLAVNKCRQYQGMFIDPVLQNLAGTLATHHQQRFQSLFQYLNSQN